MPRTSIYNQNSSMVTTFLLNCIYQAWHIPNFFYQVSRSANQVIDVQGVIL
jgi:hypothetical protein